MLTRILRGIGRGLRAHLVLVIFMGALVLAGLLVVTAPKTSTPDCDVQVAMLVSGHYDNIEGAHRCFAPDTRFAQMDAQRFEQFARSAGPSQPVQVSVIGSIAGEHSGTISVFAIRDGDPDTVLIMNLNNSGLVERVSLG